MPFLPVSRPTFCGVLYLNKVRMYLRFAFGRRYCMTETRLLIASVIITRIWTRFCMSTLRECLWWRFFVRPPHDSVLYLCIMVRGEPASWVKTKKALARRAASSGNVSLIAAFLVSRSLFVCSTQVNNSTWQWVQWTRARHKGLQATDNTAHYNSTIALC